MTLVNQQIQYKSHPSHSNDQCENERNYENKNVQTDKTPANSLQRNTNSIDGLEEKDAEMIDVEKVNNQLKSKVYSGLIFIEGLRNIKDPSPAEYFITYEGFWNECQESTEASVESIFNYLKVLSLKTLVSRSNLNFLFTAISGHLRRFFSQASSEQSPRIKTMGED